MEKALLLVLKLFLQNEEEYNFGPDCRTSINFAQGSVNVSVNKTFEEYFDFVGSEIYELGEVLVASF